MQLIRWGYSQGSGSISVHFDPVPLGLVHVSIGKHNEDEDQTSAGIYVATRYVRVGNTDEPRSNGDVAMAWDNNLSGADMGVYGSSAYVEASWMVFG